ncbi:MAG: DNA translocase FtsK [Acholeplasmataceae bacterium]|jgi:S-DNA-T family DNA segregation ATPase FtsK/SpoIIIE
MTNNHQQVKEPFKIYQLSKHKGIRSKLIYQKSHFVSPMFGRKVKDVIALPIDTSTNRDRTKELDAFRTQKKISENEAVSKYGTKYYEFNNFITSETRKAYFGHENIPEDIKEEAKKSNAKTVISPITRHRYEDAPVVEVPKKLEPNVENISVNDPVGDDPIVEETIEVTTIDLEPEESTDDAQVTMESSFFSQTQTEPVKTAEKEVLDIKPTPKSSPKPKQTYLYPDVSLFEKSDNDLTEKPEWLMKQVDQLNTTLLDFNIEGQVIDSKKGPTVTRHEIALEPGVNVKKILNIQDNITMSLAATAVRIEAPIPGKPFVGVEVPNVKKDMVHFGNIVDDPQFLDSDKPLQVALGMDIDGSHVYVNIESMPHGLIAGATNSGKSVCVNTILVSLLLKNSPDDLRLILIDPKMVEFAPYNDLPHLITPVITDSKVASQALNWAVEEMERRFMIFASSRARNLQSYNENIAQGIIEGDKMSRIVIIIDELADLIMAASKEVEDSIQRLTQKARAAGIHLIVATQRPTTDVIKGTIKSNIPVRIAFKVASFVDSTTILDGAGAEALLGRGDMLLKISDAPVRLQGAYISDDEIYKVTSMIKAQQDTNYVFGHEELKRKIEKVSSLDELFSDVARFVVEQQSCSMNSIQKQFGIGFNRAQDIVKSLIDTGIVEDAQGTKAKEVTVSLYDLDDVLKDILS